MIITVWGQGGNVGKSVISLILSRFLGKDKDKKENKKNNVLLIDLDLKNPSQNIYHNDIKNTATIDNILNYVNITNNLEKIIVNNVISHKDHDVLYGTKMPEKSLYIQPEPLQRIIEEAEKLYKSIVIDTHNVIDNAGTYIAIEKADLIITVVTQNIKDIILFNQNHIFKGLTEDKAIKYVINKYDEKSKLDINTIKELIQTDSIYTVPEFTSMLADMVNARMLHSIPLEEAEMKEINNSISFLVRDKDNEGETAYNPDIDEIKTTKKKRSIFNFGKLNIF
ncbi:MAG: hypothetical protein ACPLVF_01985 [Thermovenabulum sp.]|uniref:nucleotide-binding protein n=1 Tax=Thermovenabulum sp. TaxID=3100335 RepID=UPI003C7D67FA